MKKGEKIVLDERTGSPLTLDEVLASTEVSGAPTHIYVPFRATVTARRGDDAIEVAPVTHGATSILCDVLETADNPADRLREGDEVVVLPSPQRQERGCVLGRIRRRAQVTSQQLTPDTLILEAGKELVLRVGEGSITIRADGKILIKGKDLVSHAKRTNRIKGGSVSLN
jgi:hypothetical protein